MVTQVYEKEVFLLKKFLLLTMMFSLTLTLIGWSQRQLEEEQVENGITFESIVTLTEDYDRLEDLLSASDLVVEVEVLSEAKKIIHEYATFTVNTLFIKDVIMGDSKLVGETIQIVEHGDYENDILIVKNGDNYLLMLTEYASPFLDEGYAVTGVWHGKYKITEDDTILYFADINNTKPYQVDFGGSSLSEVKEKIRNVLNVEKKDAD